MNLDTRWLAYAIWGFGTVIIYGLVLFRAVRVRPRRDVMIAFALFLTALGAFAAVTAVLFGPIGTGIRGFFTAIALGMFTAAGLVMLTDRD